MAKWDIVFVGGMKGKMYLHQLRSMDGFDDYPFASSKACTCIYTPHRRMEIGMRPLRGHSGENTIRELQTSVFSGDFPKVALSSNVMLLTKL